MQSIQTTEHIVTKRTIYYFEVTVVGIGSQNLITIGFSKKGFPQKEQVGNIEKSYGYKANGSIFCSKRVVEFISLFQQEGAFAKFNINNTVGCGVVLPTSEIFFLIDGNVNNIVYKRVDTKDLYPTISLGYPNDEVRVNFGQHSFKFDVESMIIVMLFYINRKEVLRN